MTLRFTVPGDPVGKGRPRIDTRGKRPRTFTPDRTVAYEHAVALASMAAHRGPPLGEPCVLLMLAVHQRPGRRFPDEGRQPFARKPDIDNVVKAIADGMQPQVIRDDTLIVEAHVRQVYAAVGESPRVEVAVLPWGADVAAVWDGMVAA